MKKIFSFLAVAALMGMMVACGGNDKENKGKDGKAKDDKGSVENVANQNATNVQKYITIAEGMLEIMEQEPSIEGFEAMMKLQKQQMSMDMLTPEESAEFEKYMAEKYPELNDPSVMDAKTQEMRQKWEKWGMEHQKEAEEITRRVMGE